MAMMVNETKRKGPNVFTVMLRYAPRPWMASLGEVTELPVRCTVSNGGRGLAVDLAVPQFPLPDELARPESPRKGGLARSAFRNALREAVAAYLKCEVDPIPDDRVDWGDEIPACGAGGQC